MTKKTTKKLPPRALPPDVTEADCKYDYEASLSYREFPEGTNLPLTFYKVGGKDARADWGWVLTTLIISGKGRRGSTDRYYSIGVDDSKIYTVGRGPHVQAVVEVYITTKNRDRLWKYVELHQKGLGEAQTIRDRIGSRRAQGQLFRRGIPDWNY